MHDVTRNLLKSGIDAHPDFTIADKFDKFLEGLI